MGWRWLSQYPLPCGPIIDIQRAPAYTLYARRITDAESQRLDMLGSLLTPPRTVLVVDDQRVARRLAQRILSEAGYRAFEAEDGVEALDALDFTGPVDLMLVDVIMPRLDGVALVHQVLERWPRQRILYMSAYPAEILAQQQVADLETPFLAKPFTRDELLAKVEEALRRTPNAANQRREP
jgi:CheY-like chemotaxis protein